MVERSNRNAQDAPHGLNRQKIPPVTLRVCDILQSTSLSSGASLNPDESEDCSRVSGVGIGVMTCCWNGWSFGRHWVYVRRGAGQHGNSGDMRFGMRERGHCD
jgi:hypothetical protein